MGHALEKEGSCKNCKIKERTASRNQRDLKFEKRLQIG